MSIDKILCPDILSNASTRGSFISYSLRSSGIIIPPPSCSCGYFNSSFDSDVSVSVSHFWKSLLLTIS